MCPRHDPVRIGCLTVSCLHFPCCFAKAAGGARLDVRAYFREHDCGPKKEDSAKVLKRRGVTVAGKNGEVLTIFQSENGNSQSQCHIYQGTVKELVVDEHEFK